MSLPRGVVPVVPGPGQESVWDYPRPPAVRSASVHVLVRFADRVLCETTAALQVLETSHPPAFYLPLADVDATMLIDSQRRTTCEFKGVAEYFSITASGRTAVDAAWTYPRPWPGYQALAGHLSLYPGAMDEVLVNGEPVTPQPGTFYGGWVTSSVVGPFKGEPGSAGW